MADLDKKREVCLELVNDILVLLGYDRISELTGFMHIKRDDLKKPELMGLIESKKRVLFPLFDINKANYYERKDRKSYALCLLKYMVAEVGHKLVTKRFTKIHNKTITDYHAYFIE